MKKFIAYLVLIFIFCGIAIWFNASYTADIMLYSTMEDFRNEKLMEMLNEKFPNKKIKLQYMSTGNLAAKIKAEGIKTDADIIVELESAYMEMIKEGLADVSSFDHGQFIEEYNLGGGKYLPSVVYSFGIMYNEDTLLKLGLPIPTSYEDLLLPVYRNQIMMPSPKASGTGYIFVKAILDLYGEEDGWAYLEKLNNNIKQYTSSGSGPVNALIRGETAIGVGLMFQGAMQISKGINLKFIDVPVGYNLCGMSIIKGRENNDFVKEVFNFILNEYFVYEKSYFIPEPVTVVAPPNYVQNYPEVQSIKIKNINDINEKQRILDLWKY